jgi:hypothetical protein
MFDLSNLIGEFDKQNRILHLTASAPIRCKTREQGYALAAAVKSILNQNLSGKLGYMITDYSKIIIEPKHIDEYAAALKELMNTYLYPGGLARYGFDISRVTAQIGHRIYLGGSANLFNTKEEAFEYIHDLIARNSSHLADYSNSIKNEG